MTLTDVLAHARSEIEIERRNFVRVAHRLAEQALRAPSMTNQQETSPIVVLHLIKENLQLVLADSAGIAVASTASTASTGHRFLDLFDLDHNLRRILPVEQVTE